MSSAERNDFTRDIASAMIAHTLYPTKSEREHVAFMVIKKYPFLETNCEDWDCEYYTQYLLFMSIIYRVNQFSIVIII
jgi:hypothetical protein